MCSYHNCIMKIIYVSGIITYLPCSHLTSKGNYTVHNSHKLISCILCCGLHVRPDGRRHSGFGCVHIRQTYTLSPRVSGVCVCQVNNLCPWYNQLVSRDSLPYNINF